MLSNHIACLARGYALLVPHELSSGCRCRRRCGLGVNRGRAGSRLRVEGAVGRAAAARQERRVSEGDGRIGTVDAAIEGLLLLAVCCASTWTWTAASERDPYRRPCHLSHVASRLITSRYRFCSCSRCMRVSRTSLCWPDVAETRPTNPSASRSAALRVDFAAWTALQMSRALFASSRYPGAQRAEVADGHVHEWHGVAGRL
jgi:hypothetical protein